jgi:hypothetical protein
MKFQHTIIQIYIYLQSNKLYNKNNMDVNEHEIYSNITLRRKLK